MVPLIRGRARLSPFLSSSRPLFPSLWAPSLSLCHSFALCFPPLLLYPSIHLSRSLGRPAQLTCLNSHLSIPSIPMCLCEREPVHWARIPVPGPQPPPHLPLTIFVLLFLHPPLLSPIGLVVAEISLTQDHYEMFLYCLQGRVTSDELQCAVVWTILNGFNYKVCCLWRHPFFQQQSAYERSLCFLFYLLMSFHLFHRLSAISTHFPSSHLSFSSLLTFSLSLLSFLSLSSVCVLFSLSFQHLSPTSCRAVQRTLQEGHNSFQHSSPSCPCLVGERREL